MIEHKPTFCRICEPLCGMIATVEDGRLTSLRPDKDHPLSTGFACQKGIAFAEVVNGPDRVTTPLRRGPDGFEPVTWDEAMTDIAAGREPDSLRFPDGRAHTGPAADGPAGHDGRESRCVSWQLLDRPRIKDRMHDIVKRGDAWWWSIRAKQRPRLSSNGWGGANVNQLMSSDPADVEALAGMSWLTGVPVEVERVDSASMLHKVE